MSSGIVNVHLIPHSHDDVGWVKTKQEYYDTSVRNIYDSVFDAMVENEKRRFVASEMAFFEMWWHEQNKSVQQKVRQMVHEGRLEFAGGGYTQNDEAVTQYSAILDNLSLGSKFILKTFGKMNDIFIARD